MFKRLLVVSLLLSVLPCFAADPVWVLNNDEVEVRLYPQRPCAIPSVVAATPKEYTKDVHAGLIRDKDSNNTSKFCWLDAGKVDQRFENKIFVITEQGDQAMLPLDGFKKQ